MYVIKSSPAISNCKFQTNNADFGGGVDNQKSSTTLTNCSFESNSASAGGGMYNRQSSPTLSNCSFESNTAADGGGVASKASTVKYINCLFAENMANNNGSAIFSQIYNGSPNVGDLINCTISDNTSDNSSIYLDQSDARISNSIVWGNEHGVAVTNGGTAVYEYSIVQGQPADEANGNLAGDTDPLFADADNGGYSLKTSSPCINKGSNGLVPAGITVDLVGNARIQQGTVDMGAYEGWQTSLVVSPIQQAICSGSEITPIKATTDGVKISWERIASTTISSNIAENGASGTTIDISGALTTTRSNEPDTMWIKFGAENSLGNMTNPVIAMIIVHPYPVVAIEKVAPQCINTGNKIALQATSAGGQWGGTGLDNTGVDNSGVFNPAIAGVGNHNITYTLTKEGCTSIASIEIVVNDTTPIVLQPIAPVCASSSYLLLNQQQPDGGVWSGNGILEDGNRFDPAAGSQTLTYTYTNGAGCVSSASTKVSVIQFDVNVVTLVATPTIIACGSSANSGSVMLQNEFYTPSGNSLNKTYRWYNLKDVYNTIATTQNLQNVPAGAYGVEITVSSASSDGCAAHYATTAEVIAQNVITGNMVIANNRVKKNDPAPYVSLIASGGSAPYEFVYSINDKTDIVRSGQPRFNLSQPTGSIGSFVYKLISVANAEGCKTAINQMDTIRVVDGDITASSVSDLTTLAQLLPTLSNGASNHILLISIDELAGKAASGEVAVYVSKDSKYDITFDSTKTSLSIFDVQNAGWILDKTANIGFYKLYTHNTIPANGRVTLGIELEVNAPNVKGAVNVISSLPIPKSGDGNLGNNVDTEIMILK